MCLVITHYFKNLQLDQVAVLFPQLVSFLKWFCFINPQFQFLLILFMHIPTVSRDSKQHYWCLPYKPRQRTVFSLKANRSREKMHLCYRIQQKGKGCHEGGSRRKARFAKVFGCLQGLRVQLLQLRCFQRGLIMRSIHCHKTSFEPASSQALITPGTEDLTLQKYPQF